MADQQNNVYPMEQQPGYPPQQQQQQQQQGYMQQQTGVAVVAQPGVIIVQARPNDYLGISICSAFLCLPLAIFAIIFSCFSKSSSDSNDFVKATSQGRTARNFAIAAIIIGILLVIIIPIVYFVVIAAAVTTTVTRIG